MGSVVPERLYPSPLHQEVRRTIAPVEGYSPLVGTLVSMLNWMRPTVIRAVQDLTQDELDYLYDSEANTIGALTLHLGAAELMFQRNTLGRRDLSVFKDRDEYLAARELGAPGRVLIKGRSVDYYLSSIEEVRAWTIEELRHRDDDWLAEEFQIGSVVRNNFDRWFHVCEHEAHHRGQIVWLKKRLPGHEFANAVREG